MNKKLKVIQLIDSLHPGGAEMMAVHIANELVTHDTIESHLCATRLEGDLKAKMEQSVGYVCLNKQRVLDLKAFKMLNAYIKVHQISIIHAHSSSYFIGFLMKLWNPNLKLIWHDHYGKSDYLDTRSTFPLAFISNYFHTVIAVNMRLKAWSEQHLNAKDVKYLPNFAVFTKHKTKETLLKGKEGKRIVCLANLRPQKDHLNLLKAFKRIQLTHPDWTLHIVGQNLNDGYAQEIKSFITSHNLSNHVFLYGSRNDVEFILSQATIGVLASNSEGLPVSLLEYGLAKLPTVVTDVGECAEVVKHNTSGIIVPSQDEKVLAAGLTTFIENEHKRKLFGVALFKRVNENYSKTNFIKTLLNIYTS